MKEVLEHEFTIRKQHTAELGNGYAEEEKHTTLSELEQIPYQPQVYAIPIEQRKRESKAAGGRGGVSAEAVSDDRTAGDGGGAERPLHKDTEYRKGIYGEYSAGGSDRQQRNDGSDAETRRTGWEKSREVYFELLRNPFEEYRDAERYNQESATENYENNDRHSGIGGSAVAAGLRGVLEAGSIIDGTAEDPEERRKRIEAQENASNLGAVIGLAVGVLTAAADSEEDMSAEENDEPAIKM